MPQEIRDIIKEIENIENDDTTLEQLENGMNYFCSTWDKCEGFKHAIIETLEDQYTYHQSEQDPGDIKKLLTILNIL